MRLTTLLIVLLGSSTTAAAYTVSPQRSSYFVGHSVYHTTAAAPQTSSSSRVTSSNLTMKKGKANVPPQMRSQYARAQEMENYRQQMMESQRMGADGLPVFNLYVRTSLKNVSCYVACCLYLLLLYYYDIVHYGDNIPCNHRVVTSNLRILTLYLFLATKTTCYAILLLYKIIINYIRT